MTHALLDDHGTEVMIGNLLRAGVVMAATVVACGAVIYLSHYAFEPANFRVFRGEAAALRTLPAIVKGAMHLHGKSIIQFWVAVAYRYSHCARDVRSRGIRH